MAPKTNSMSLTSTTSQVPYCVYVSASTVDYLSATHIRFLLKMLVFGLVGFGKMPGYEHIFTDFLLKLVPNKYKKHPLCA
jgi:hypothetical protein